MRLIWDFLSQLTTLAEIPQKYQNSLDWRNKTQNPKNLIADTGVKDQGACGSCYIFSAVAAIEGSLCLNQLQNCEELTGGLSEQQVLNCATYDETREDKTFEKSLGCNGGWQSNVFQYVYQTGGLTDETTIPYVSGEENLYPNKFNKGKCPYTFETKNDWIARHSKVALNRNICGTISKGGILDSNLMSQAVFAKGPLAISMYVGENFRHYSAGIYVPDENDENDCPTDC